MAAVKTWLVPTPAMPTPKMLKRITAETGKEEVTLADPVTSPVPMRYVHFVKTHATPSVLDAQTKERWERDRAVVDTNWIRR